MKTYWKPHFITKKVTINGVEYYKTGIHEVHYEDDVPVMWTENSCDVTTHEESLEESYEQACGLHKLYQAASNNIPFNEIEKDGKTILEPWHPDKRISFKDNIPTFDFTNGEDGEDVEILLDDDLINSLKDNGFDINTVDGLVKFKELLVKAIQENIDSEFILLNNEWTKCE